MRESGKISFVQQLAFYRIALAEKRVKLYADIRQMKGLFTIIIITKRDFAP